MIFSNFSVVLKAKTPSAAWNISHNKFSVIQIFLTDLVVSSSYPSFENCCQNLRKNNPEPTGLKFQHFLRIFRHPTRLIFFIFLFFDLLPCPVKHLRTPFCENDAPGFDNYSADLLFITFPTGNKFNFNKMKTTSWDSKGTAYDYDR